MNQQNATICIVAFALADRSHVTLRALGHVTKPAENPWSEATKHGKAG